MTDSYVPDRPVICPYDSNHIIAASRFQRHIIKCSKNFPPNYRLSCPYNATHRLPKIEMEDHITTCSDRKFLDPVIYEGLSSHGSVMNSEMEDRSVIHCDENWDEDEGTLYELSSICSLDDASKPLLRMNNYDEPPLDSSFEASAKPLVKSVESRPPLGRAEALMIEESDDSIIEDIESVKSFMVMGRGKLLAKRNNESILKKIGISRGSSAMGTEH